MYRENDLPVFGGGYDKTFFSLIDEQGQELTRFRYDVGSETATISEQVSSVLTQDYLRLAEEADSRVTGRVGDTEKAPDQNQGPVAEESSMGLDNLSVSNEDTQKERTNFSKGSLQPEAEGSTAPVSESSDTFERSVTSRPTLSSHPLHFSIKDGYKSRKSRLEHSVDKQDLDKINRRSHDLQEAAQFYRDELANSTISYFTSDGSIAQVNFLEKNFMHLTGLKPLGKDQVPEKTLHDFASGGEIEYDIVNTSTPSNFTNGKSSMREKPVKSVSPLIATSFKY